MVQERIDGYLQQIDQVIADGQYKDNWASLSTYPIPEWYQRAKFGIFIHWGVYSVPAFGNEWYPRNMYMEGSKEYEHHINTYGSHKEFGYKDFIPMFRAERFDAKEWIRLFQDAGAKYVMPVAEHHDGFQMYDSELSDFNALKMGPQRDVLGELKAACDEADLVFSASSHRAENYFFFCGGKMFESGMDPNIEYQEPYGYGDVHFCGEQHHVTHNIHEKGPTKAHLDDWLVRTCELVDKYQPRIVWFDWWIHNMAFKPYLKKFAAYYYNRAAEWGAQVAINYKYDAYALSTAVFDVERGQLSDIRPRLWQTDTAIAKNSWGYTENNDFKQPEDIVSDLVDIVSKNGCLLLNVGPKSDGTITAEDRNVLLRIGQWLKVNGEGIYDTTYWSVFGEGPTQIEEGAFTDTKREKFAKEDIRFTYKAPYIYAYSLGWGKGNTLSIQSLKAYSQFFLGHIEDVEVLGYDRQVQFTQDEDALHIQLDQEVETTYPLGFKIRID